MNIEDLNKAMSIKNQLVILQRYYDRIAEGGELNIIILSDYQDDNFVNAIRPNVLAEVENRIKEAKKSLTDLGVTGA